MTDPVSSTLQQRTLSILFTFFALAGALLQNNLLLQNNQNEQLSMLFINLMSDKDHLLLAEQSFSRSVPSHPAFPVPDQNAVVLSFRNNFSTLSTVALVRIEFFPAGDFQRTDWTCLFSLDRFLPRCYFERYRSRKIIPFLSYVRLSCVRFIATHFKSRRPKTTLTIFTKT